MKHADIDDMKQMDFDGFLMGEMCVYKRAFEYT